MIDEAEYLQRLEKLHRSTWPQGVPSEVRYPLDERPVTAHLKHWAATRGDLSALVFYGRQISYSELNRLSDAFASVLADSGVRKGDRVAVFLPNCPQFHIAFFGILKLGAVHVPVSPLYREVELTHILKESQSRAIVALDLLMPLVRAVRDECRIEHVFTTSVSSMLPTEPDIQVPGTASAAAVECADASDFLAAIEAVDIREYDNGDLDSVAALNFTGGTTGLPKGCVHTQRHMVYTAAANWTVAMGRDDDIVWLSFFPEFWIAGQNSALTFPVVTGRPLVLMTRWDPLAFLQAVDKYGVTHTALIVDGAVELMDHACVGEFDLTSLRRVRVVSFVKKLDVEIRKRWKALTGSTLVESSWGMTETNTSSSFTVGMQDDDLDLKSVPIFVGLPIPRTEFKICDFTTGALVPLGEEGEIVVRSPALFEGYWQRPAETAAVVKNGWLHTGDIGVIDKKGYLHYLGRRKEMLKVNGMSVFPSELESLLGKHPAVLGSGVVGRDDKTKGQVPVAFVQLRNEYVDRMEAEEIGDWLRERVAAFKVPQIRLVGSLPLTSTGKIKKSDLTAILARENADTAQ